MRSIILECEKFDQRAGIAARQDRVITALP
jgi:hypothetical protein